MKEFFKKVVEGWPSEPRLSPEEERAAKDLIRRERLYTAEGMLRDLYIVGEENLSNSTNEMSQTLSQFPTLSSKTREEISRIRDESQRRGIRFNDQLLQMAEESFFADLDVDEQTKADIRLRAIKDARDYWEGRIQQADATQDELMLGRRRITQLTSRLEDESGLGDKSVDQE